MLPLALRHQMYQMRARFEGVHHASGRLVEHGVGHMIEEMALELEVDDEVHMSLVACWRKRPRICQVLERPPFRCAHQDLPRSIQLNVARKAFPEWAEPDLEFSDDFLRTFAVDTRASAPGHE
jgi:hypothetical protein